MSSLSNLKLVTTVVVVLFSIMTTNLTHAASPQKKKVCYTITVKGKKVQKCSLVKIHKKFDGTPIPGKSKPKK
ncbi:hypothetical protein UFOVP116_372 [uncultured Caudovirales phage]|uniref:Uncharacterized protein n=1 Tax=uncultured Caudovirales phage TaxID=2100421 RepID=A0A6J5L8G8_9CAUD|nr:hypothetical protein UFOVP116_372 [uncultured Caudovirales phage]